MWYIVYRNKYISYSRETGGGYYVGYKNKIEDKFSSNYVEANKYKSIGPAITRLGINLFPGMTMDRLLKSIKPKDIQAERNGKLNQVFDIDIKENPIDIIFSNGRIEIVSETGELLGSAEKEVISYIEGKTSDNKTKALNSFEYITEGNDDSFWDEKNW
jgi:hypothetical protein